MPMAAAAAAAHPVSAIARSEEQAAASMEDEKLAFRRAMAPRADKAMFGSMQAAEMNPSSAAAGKLDRSGPFHWPAAPSIVLQHLSAAGGGMASPPPGGILPSPSSWLTGGGSSGCIGIMHTKRQATSAPMVVPRVTYHGATMRPPSSTNHRVVHTYPIAQAANPIALASKFSIQELPSSLSSQRYVDCMVVRPGSDLGVHSASPSSTSASTSSATASVSTSSSTTSMVAGNTRPVRAFRNRASREFPAAEQQRQIGRASTDSSSRSRRSSDMSLVTESTESGTIATQRQLRSGVVVNWGNGHGKDHLPKDRSKPQERQKDHQKEDDDQQRQPMKITRAPGVLEDRGDGKHDGNRLEALADVAVEAWYREFSDCSWGRCVVHDGRVISFVRKKVVRRARAAAKYVAKVDLSSSTTTTSTTTTSVLPPLPAGRNGRTTMVQPRQLRKRLNDLEPRGCHAKKAKREADCPMQLRVKVLAAPPSNAKNIRKNSSKPAASSRKNSSKKIERVMGIENFVDLVDDDDDDDDDAAHRGPKLRSKVMSMRKVLPCLRGGDSTAGATTVPEVVDVGDDREDDVDDDEETEDELHEGGPQQRMAAVVPSRRGRCQNLPSKLQCSVLGEWRKGKRRKA